MCSNIQKPRGNRLQPVEADKTPANQKLRVATTLSLWNQHRETSDSLVICLRPETLLFEDYNGVLIHRPTPAMKIGLVNSIRSSPSVLYKHA